MIFISAGHHSKAKNKPDPGYVNPQGVKEGDLNIEFRDLVTDFLDLMGYKYIKDHDDETLREYLKRIKTGSGSVVLEYHFDAASSPTIGGCTAFVPENASKANKVFAKELCDITSQILNINNRGVKSERLTNAGSLAIMRESGLVCLLELAFLSNPVDMEKYHRHKKLLAPEHAKILAKYEDMFS